MKRSSLSMQIMIPGLLVLSMVSVYLAIILKPSPREIFRLAFNPLNVETNANVDVQEQTITFQNLHQTLTISNVNAGILQMVLTFSGGWIVDEPDLTHPTFMIELNQTPTAIPITSLTLAYEHRWVQFNRGAITLVFQNFVKIEAHMYALILSDIAIVYHP